MRDRSDEAEAVGPGVLTRDGHMTYSPDGRWLVTDEYPSGDPPAQPLLLFELATGRRVEVGRSAAPLAGGSCGATCTRAGTATARRSASTRPTPARGRCMWRT